MATNGVRPGAANTGASGACASEKVRSPHISPGAARQRRYPQRLAERNAQPETPSAPSPAERVTPALGALCDATLVAKPASLRDGADLEDLLGDTELAGRWLSGLAAEVRNVLRHGGRASQ